VSCSDIFASDHLRYTQHYRTHRELLPPLGLLRLSGSGGQYLAQQEQQKQEQQQQQQQQQYEKAGSPNYWRTTQSGITKDTSGAAEERGGNRSGGLLRTCCIIIVVIAVERVVISDWRYWYRHTHCSNGRDCCRYRLSRPWYVGPGELLRAPPTRAAQADTWANGPGHTRAGLTSNSRNILVSTRSPTKQQREQRHQLAWYEHAHQIIRYKNKEQRGKQKQKGSISNITSEETLRFDHSSRKSLTQVITPWRESKNKVCELLNNRNIHRNSQWKVCLKYLEGEVKKRCYIIQRYWRYIAADILRITAATTISLQSASREQKESKRIKKRSTCGRADFSFDGSNAGPPATARPQYGLFTSRIHCKSASSSSSLVDECNIEERKSKKQTAKRLVVRGGRRTVKKHAKECRRRRQNIGDISVPNHLLTLMRLDSLVVLTGPSTSKKKRNKKRKEQRTEGKEEEEEEEEEEEKNKGEGEKEKEKEEKEKKKEEKKERKEEEKKKEKKKERKKKEKKKKDKKKEQQLRSSSLLPPISFVEYVPFVCIACCSYTSSKSFSRSNCDCNVDNGGVFTTRCHVDKTQHGKYELDKEIGIATAFHVSCDFALHEVVRACMYNCHRDYENGNDDAAIIIIMSCARTRTLHIGRSLRRQQISRFARRTRRKAQRRKNGTISEEKSDVVVSAIPFVDVLAYTAYNNDKDDNVNDERQTCCERNKIHNESKEFYNEHKNDSDMCTSVSNNLCDKHEYEDADENIPCQDYIYTEVDAISHYVLQNDQWISPSLSFDRKKLRRCCEYEHVDNYNREHSTNKKFIGQQRRKEAECSRRKYNDNTAWFQKPIIQKKKGDEKERRRSGESIVDKSHIRKSYYKLLLFMLYLLAWPLLCSTSPSGHLASTFAQKTLAHAKNSAQQANTTLSDASLFLSSTIIMHQYQQPQQYIQNSDHDTDDDKHHQHYYQQEQKQLQQWQEQKQQSQQWQQQQQQEKKEKREQQLEQAKEWRHPYNGYNWDINQMNPWLSACDLAGPAPADLQGSCGPPEVPKYCPVPCDGVVVIPRSQHDDVFREVIERIRIGNIKTMTTMTTTGTRTRTEIEDGEESDDRHRRVYHTKQKKEGKKIKEQKKKENIRMAPEQCLFYLEKSHKEDICRDDFGRASTQSFLTPRENRYWFMSGLRLRHCCEHAVVNALAPGKGGPLEDVLNGGQKCADALDKLLHVDALAARLHCEFEEVLARYDCAQPYSVIHNCTHCKVSNDDFSPYSIY